METNIGNIFNEFKCNICNKIYANKSGIWKHNNKYHKDISKSEVSNHNLQTKKLETFVSQESVSVSLNNIQKNDNNHKYHSCDYCGTSYLHRQSKYKHQLKCKNKSIENKKIENENNIINLLVEQIKEQKELINEQKKMFEKQIDEMKKQLIETMNKKCKVHPKTLQKINKQLNCNNMVKNTNNITYNIVGLGHENLTEVFTRKEKMAILKNRFYCLPELVEYTHFNDKYPQFKNILITNTQNTLAYKYDNKKQQFVAVNKDELLDDIVDERMCDISSFYDELENDLDEKTKEIIEKVKEKIENDPAYRELKKKDIKLIIYNNRKKVVKDNLIDDLSDDQPEDQFDV